ncbi:MAG: S9 family peptidase, partial [Anaerolineales bacterium]|nr:S9 family peptidase [Anaerolineales bacterium]
IRLSALSSVTALHARQGTADIFLKVESYLDPGTVYHCDPHTAVLTPIWHTAVSFDADRFETTQVFFPSKDGTPVSMFLTHAKNLPRHGDHPLLLYGYGGFNANHTPAFAPHVIQWLERGGIFADVNLRGGGEYGQAWHEAGMLQKKQTVFDDFIAAAEWLITNGYTQPGRLATIGRSNGGLLTAATLLQRPDLFGAVVSVVPVTDMLRFQRFTAGRYWTVEYGNAAENPDHFQFLYAYSPLHNVRHGAAYPPTLLTTADGDDRVVPLHAMKFAATLQANAASTLETNPLLIRIDTKSGHGLGKPISKWLDEWADIYAFLAHTVQKGA